MIKQQISLLLSQTAAKDADYLEFISESSVEARSVVYEAVVDRNNSVDEFPVMTNEQIIDVIQTQLQPVAETQWQRLVNAHARQLIGWTQHSHTNYSWNEACTCAITYNKTTIHSLIHSFQVHNGWNAKKC